MTPFFRRGATTLVIGALRDKPHPTHFTVDQALQALLKLRAEDEEDYGVVSACLRGASMSALAMSTLPSLRAMNPSALVAI